TPPGDTQRRLATLRDDIAQLVVRLRQTDRAVSEPALAFLQRQVYRDFVTSFQRLQANLNPRMVGLADVPAEIPPRFISHLGNIFGIPLILGAAAEFGLNIVMRFIEGRDHGGPLVARSTIMAVFVNGLTTMVGFGSLMLAAHRGIYGLGLLLTLGMFASLVA